MSVNSDFRDLFRMLNTARARYLVVGAHAVMFYAEPRYTKDLDLWVDPDPANAAKVWKALALFGAPLEGVTAEDFANPRMVYQVGIAPNRFDIIMGLSGVRFPDAWRNKSRTSYGGVPIHVLGKKELIRNKRLVGRPQDVLDVANLQVAAKRTHRRRG